MKVLFVTNVPSPYRVDFFNELGKYCDLTVLYERKSASDRDDKWKGSSAESFKEIYLHLKPVGADRSSGNAISKYVGKSKFDILIFTNYVSPATMNAIAYCRIHRIPYYVEYDGGFNKKDRFPKNLVKKFLLCGAKAHLTTCEEHKMYLMGLGIPQERIFKYPFTSVKKEDIFTDSISETDKENIRSHLGMKEEKIILSVGRFSYDKGYGKGFDLLLKLAEKLDEDKGIYIVGDEPAEEFVKIKEERQLKSVHFVGFKEKEQLVPYYLAADVFVLLTRGDVWGLVVNEAMANGLPVITTTKCVAGMELVKDGENGYLVESGDYKQALAHVNEILGDLNKKEKMAGESRKIIADYTIEKMADIHLKTFGGGYRDWIRSYYRAELGISEEYVVLAVGQFIPRKGFDVLLEAAREIDRKIGIYIVGGNPTDEYLKYKTDYRLDSVHFCGYKPKLELKKYYLAADVFVHPTREDIWGLVINEAMAYELPVVTTDKCIAGQELIIDGRNGYLVPAEDDKTLAAAIKEALEHPLMGHESLKIIKGYSIEKMAERHLEILGKLRLIS